MNMPKLAIYKVAIWTDFGETKEERLVSNKTIIIWKDKFARIKKKRSPVVVSLGDPIFYLSVFYEITFFL